MEISVLDKQTIQCVMTEEEIADYGMDKNAIYKNDERVEDFFRQIMQKAEQETGFTKDGGNIAVHAAFLSDESLEITFSVVRKETEKEGVLDGPKETAKKEGAQKDAADTRKKEQERDRKLAEQTVATMETAVLKSKHLAHLADFCKIAPKGLKASIYRYRDVYFLLADVGGYGVRDTAVLFYLADEYVDGICYTRSIAAFIEEHGQCIAKGDAVEKFADL